jgi:hypothetical protein
MVSFFVDNWWSRGYRQEGKSQNWEITLHLEWRYQRRKQIYLMSVKLVSKRVDWRADVPAKEWVAVWTTGKGFKTKKRLSYTLGEVFSPLEKIGIWNHPFLDACSQFREYCGNTMVLIWFLTQNPQNVTKRWQDQLGASFPPSRFSRSLSRLKIVYQELPLLAKSTIVVLFLTCTVFMIDQHATPKSFSCHIDVPHVMELPREKRSDGCRASI